MINVLLFFYLCTLEIPCFCSVLLLCASSISVFTEAPLVWIRVALCQYLLVRLVSHHSAMCGDTLSTGTKPLCEMRH